jgi:hypothetical protein
MRETPPFIYEGTASGNLGRRGRKISGMGRTAGLGTRGWLEISTGVALAIAAEPIHELGHALAVWLTAGAWPEVGFWAVHPTSHFESTQAVLAVLAAGEAAVIGWWGLVCLIALAQPHLRWALIGPTFTAVLALLNWFAAAVLTPFGYGQWGASDALKFMMISGIGWQKMAVLTTFMCCIVAIVTARCFSRHCLTKSA